MPDLPIIASDRTADRTSDRTVDRGGERDINRVGSPVVPAIVRIARPVALKIQYEIKSAVHLGLIKRLDLDKIAQMHGNPASQQQLVTVIQTLIGEQNTPLSSAERDRLTQEVLDEVFGLGPLEALLQDPTVNDILVNTFNAVYVERRGVLEKTSVLFNDNRHLMQVIDKIVSAVGRRVDESSPMVDARLKDGSRVNVIIPPLAVDGPILSIRKFGSKPLVAEDLLRNKALTEPMLEILKGAVEARLNIIVSGGTGAGKTTLLNVLSGFIDERERIVTIEDSAELQIKHAHVVRLECRPPNVEGTGAIKQRELVINALRMRPDRIVLGECRGEECMDMLQAMNTGHDGSHHHRACQHSAGCSGPHGDHGHDGRGKPFGKGDSIANRLRRPPDCADRPHERWLSPRNPHCRTYRSL